MLLGLRTPEFHMADLGDALPGLGSHAIIGFAIAPEDANGDRPFWPLAECQRAFELLNRDVRPRLPDLSPEEAALAGHLVHIGQPVQLRPDVPTAPTVLRLVLGARFFTIVGYAEDPERALQSQIDDALLALAKLELLIRHWDQLQPAAA